VAVASRSDAARESSPPVRNPANGDRVDASERRAEHDRNRVRDLLDNPNLRRILIVVDEIGGTARDRVESIVRKAPRIDSSFGRISVAQGITIDPRYPGEAIVFAVVMSDDELRRFKGELSQEFPDSVEDVAAEPTVVTQLSGIGQVAMLSGTPAADLHAPPDAAAAPLAAMRIPARPKTPAVLPDPEFSNMTVVETTDPIVSPVGSATDANTKLELRRPPHEPRGLASTPPTGPIARSNAAKVEPPAVNIRPGTPSDDRSIVLVWVTNRERRRADRPGLSAPPAS